MELFFEIDWPQTKGKLSFRLPNRKEIISTLVEAIQGLDKLSEEEKRLLLRKIQELR